MKGPAGHATKLSSLLKKHAPSEAPTMPTWSAETATDPVGAFVHSVLAWEAALASADAAFVKLADRLIDWNDLRVCLVEETMEIIGVRYPLAFERLRIMRTSLTAVYQRHHKVDLAHLASAGKREARAYLEGLPGVPAFVAHRTLLLVFGQPLVPVDARLLGKLQDAGVIAPGVSTADAAAWISKEVGAERSVAAHHALHAFADSTPDKPIKTAITETKPQTKPQAKPQTKPQTKPETKPAAGPVAKDAEKASSKSSSSTPSAKSAARPAAAKKPPLKKPPLKKSPLKKSPLGSVARSGARKTASKSKG